jgi:hypothetical protein
VARNEMKYRLMSPKDQNRSKGIGSTASIDSQKRKRDNGGC